MQREPTKGKQNPDIRGKKCGTFRNRDNIKAGKQHRQLQQRTMDKQQQ